MPLLRSIGRWSMTALVINCIIGSGIFGLPGELTRLLGRASPLAILPGALGTGVIMACMTEVASQFSEPGGPYHYVRTAFGPFLGLQVGWFHLLSVIAGMAAVSHLFMDYFSTFLPMSTMQRDLLLALLIAIPTIINYFGARSGAQLSNVMTAAKITPPILLIVLGALHFGPGVAMIRAADLAAAPSSNWLRAFVLMLFLFGGWEDSLILGGEVQQPRRTIPLALGVGLLTCTAIYMSVQFVTVGAIGTHVTQRPLADVASVLIGEAGATAVAIAAMISTYGSISGYLLHSPRLAYSFASEGDFPGFFARLHPRFHTPAVSIILFALTGWLLAISGTFLWIAALAAASEIPYYAVTCASLGRLRKMRPNAEAFRVPFGPALSFVAVGVSLVLLTGLQLREILLMGVTALIAAANWAWVRRQVRRAVPAETGP